MYENQRYCIKFTEYNPKKHIILTNRESYYEVINKEDLQEVV